VFSASYDRLAEVSSKHLVSYLPLGMFPSEDDIDRRRLPPAPVETKRFSVNQIELMGSDDILLLYTDGLAELARDGERFVPERLEEVLRRVKRRSAQEIFDTVVAEAVAYAEPEDDLSLVVIKRF
jgi:serine phosphatase RsbU (regulator of sigma subunit)